MRPAIATTKTVFERPIQRCHPVLEWWLFAGIVMTLFLGDGAILAGAAFAIIAAVSYVSGFLRFHRRGVVEAARTSVALAAVTPDTRAAAVIQAAIVIHAASAAQRAVGLAILLTSTRRSAALQLARVGHRRIAHIALTARVVPAPIARA
ncbi:MAG: hypothetical protein AB7S53_01680 [Thiomonas sp.]|jgi:hypothetical protein|uniref:hypothetical protein n=1 Tax=Thiomonas arsenitoxydans (strain DSM 22701 / CIP 110005 / 3As) TaxID=426114 RepID=UPI001AC61E8B|nr:hypothetical protein [Thiomonas arsenitoxydans]MBN8775229.1 hypothetical protein [Thiomonas arsenitoxydans]MDE2269936.1 hypothetical protein [Betaproteobacteria bacterium]